MQVLDLSRSDLPYRSDQTERADRLTELAGTGVQGKKGAKDTSPVLHGLTIAQEYP